MASAPSPLGSGTWHGGSVRWKRLAPDRAAAVRRLRAQQELKDSKTAPGKIGQRGVRPGNAGKRPGVIAAVQVRFGGKRYRAAGVAKVCPVCLQGMGHDLFSGGPGLAIDVKAGIELDSGAFRDGCRITRPAVGMGGRTGIGAGPGAGTCGADGVS